MLSPNWLSHFQCTGDKCPDTCCKGWGMQVDDATMAKYQAEAPELLDAITSGEADHIMRRDPETDYCVKFDAGWCGVHASRGTDFLGDACHFFPRVTRQLGDRVIQMASLSCPEVARLALGQGADVSWQEAEEGRLPYSLQDYLPDELDAESAWQLHQAFLSACEDETADAGRIIARLHAVCESLLLIDKATWPMAAPFYLKSADSRLTQPKSEANDPFHLFHSLYGLVGAAPKSSRPRLEAVLADMQATLDVELSGAHLIPGNNTARNLQQIQESWQFVDSQWQPFFKRWLQTQLSIALFPFAGFGDSLNDRITVLGARLATLKLALQAHFHQHGTLEESDALRITQALARFLDHLADPTLSMRIYAETGWVKRERLWGLLG